MTKRLFQAFSLIFHPILMPLIGMLIILLFTHLALIPIEAKKAISKIVILSTILLPLAPLPVLYYQKFISSYQIPKRSERLIPLLLTVIFYYFGYYILNRLGAPKLVQHYIFAAFVSVLIAAAINFKYKISTHMIGIGGLIGLISILGFLYNINLSYILMVLILIAGITGTARLYLNAHSQSQVYSGFLLGFVATFAVILLMNNF